MRVHYLTLLLILGFSSCSYDKVYELDIRELKDKPVEKVFSFDGLSPDGCRLSVNNQYLTRNGQPWIPIMGEFHYTRYPHQYWEEEIRKMKSAGIDIIATYVFWETHENPRGQWNWSGDCNLSRFIDLCKKNDMYVWLRVGPYCNAELLHGGLPAWIDTMKGRRSNDSGYLYETRRYYSKVAEQVKGKFFEEGGPIIGMQVENEYADGQPEHPDSLKQIAMDLDMKPVYFSLTANSVFHDDRFGFLPLQGSYPYRGWEAGGGTATLDFLYGNDQWILNSAFGGRLYYDPDKYPRGLCEQGCGSQMELNNRFSVAPAIVEAHLQNQIGRGMNLIGYYMFQGGTQTPGQKRKGYPESYDFQAPLSEFGEVRDSYRCLKILHHFLNDFGNELAPMQVTRPAQVVDNAKDTASLRYIARTKGNSGFVFMNNAQVRIPMPDKSFRMSINLNNEVIEFPRKNMLLKGETTAILPFNMNINGINLRYATAQPLARFSRDSTEYFFLMKLRGMDVELAVDAQVLKNLNHQGWSIETNDGVSYLSPKGGNHIDMTSSDGKRVILVLLSREEAENCWRTTIAGQEYMMISNADLSWCGDTIQMNQLSNNNFTLKMFPEFPNALKVEGKIVKQTKEGIFSAFKTSVPPISVNLPIKDISVSEREINLPTSLPENLNDIFLKIDYCGGSATTERNGKILNDHLYHGQPWMLGLKRYLNGDMNNSTLLRVYPWDDNINGIPEDAVKQIKKEGVMLKDVTALPQYTISLHL
ncbi:MAG: beta-galactosidase [Bacteroidales bacterium]